MSASQAQFEFPDRAFILFFFRRYAVPLGLVLHKRYALALHCIGNDNARLALDRSGLSNAP